MIVCFGIYDSILFLFCDNINRKHFFRLQLVHCSADSWLHFSFLSFSLLDTCQQLVKQPLQFALNSIQNAEISPCYSKLGLCSASYHVFGMIFIPFLIFSNYFSLHSCNLYLSFVLYWFRSHWFCTLFMPLFILSLHLLPLSPFFIVLFVLFFPSSYFFLSFLLDHFLLLTMLSRCYPLDLFLLFGSTYLLSIFFLFLLPSFASF